MNELSLLPFDISNKSFLYILNANIHDYAEPINSSDYILIKVNQEIKSIIQNILELVQLDIKQEVIDDSKYILVTDVLFDLDRVECHLHNRFNKEASEYSKSVICGIDIKYADWRHRFKSSANVLDISINGIDDILKLRLDFTKPLNINEVDAQYIVTKLLESKDNSLFRGINKYYFNNDGIAASIYRNNFDLAKYGMLQEHEKEVINRLLSKEFYKPNTDKKSIYALTDLRHSGKDTCLLDFSEDFKIALFFSCYPTKTATIGEILILSKAEYEEKQDITYPNDNDFLIKPSITEVTGKRAEAQSSVFLYCHQGFLPRNKCENKVNNLIIAPRLKSAFYSYCGYSEESIYPDFHGFIENPENFNTEAKIKCIKLDEDNKKDYV
jgi:hypothetical protein